MSDDSYCTSCGQRHCEPWCRKDEQAQALAERDELLDALADCIGQACGDNTLDSMALSAYRDGLELLVKHGRVVIESQHGRRVIARWTTKDNDETPV